MTEQSNGTVNATAPLVAALPLTELPRTTRGELSADDLTLAKAIAEVANATTAARLAETFADRDAAVKRAGALRRMLVRANVVPKGKAARTRVVTIGDTFGVAAYFGDPGSAPGRKPKA